MTPTSIRCGSCPDPVAPVGAGEPQAIVAAMIRIGIDIGGTFTDLWLAAEDGRCWSTKVLTTPDDPSVGFFRALGRAFDADPGFRDVREIAHATTLAVNALLEGDTARLGLITTAGFRDVLEIGRHFRRDLYNFFLE